MISIFSTLKPMDTEQVSRSQRNAVLSWTKLSGTEVILIGNEEGVAKLAREAGAKHVPDMQRSETGMPLLSSLFQTGWEHSTYPICAYVNADIILLDDFVEVAAILPSVGDRFLAVGQRWNVLGIGSIDFEQDWQADLVAHIVDVGACKDSKAAADYFIHTKGLWTSLLNIPIARFYWDNHLIWGAGTAEKVPVVDTSDAVTAIHQFHDLIAWFTDPEVMAVGKVIGGRMAGINHSGHVMGSDMEIRKR